MWFWRRKGSPSVCGKYGSAQFGLSLTSQEPLRVTFRLPLRLNNQRKVGKRIHHYYLWGCLVLTGKNVAS